MMWSAELTFRDELADPGALVHVQRGLRALHLACSGSLTTILWSQTLLLGCALDTGWPCKTTFAPTREPTRAAMYWAGVPCLHPPSAPRTRRCCFSTVSACGERTHLRGVVPASRLCVLRSSQCDHTAETSSGYCLAFCDCLDDFVVFATGLRRSEPGDFQKISSRVPSPVSF